MSFPTSFQLFAENYPVLAMTLGQAARCCLLLLLAMLLRYSLGELEYAERIEAAVGEVLDQGLRTADIAGAADSIGTREMGIAVVAALRTPPSR